MFKQHGPASFGTDTQVQGTNDDAQCSKMSCTRLGYFKDDFIQYFVRRPSRRSPLINRGYYSRYAAVRHLLAKFLRLTREAGLPQQVLSVGAGFDTTWFQLRQEGQAPTKFVEVDFKEVTKRKASIISSQPALHSLLPPASAEQGSASTAPAPAADGAAQQQQQQQQQPAGAATAASAPPHPGISVEKGQVLSSSYCLLPVDLKDLAGLGAAIKLAGMDPSAPTFILSECVLVYMDAEDSSALTQWLGQHFPCAAMAVYEQVRPHDAFGRQMLMNMEARGAPLKSLLATPTLEAHCKRFTDNGWSGAAAWDMGTIYRSFLDPADRARVERLEIFDEFEEWHLIQEHYCIAVGYNSQAPASGGEAAASGDARCVLDGFTFDPLPPSAVAAAGAAPGQLPPFGRPGFPCAD